MKKTITSLVAICAIGVCALAGCEGGGGKGKVGEGFAIANKAELQETWTLADGSRQITFVCDDEEFNPSALISSGDIVVESSNTDVVSVVGSLLYPMSEGTATITATYGKSEDSVELAVLDYDWTTPFEVGSEYYLGFEYQNATWYIDGTTVAGYSYEGSITTDISEAVTVKVEEGSGLGEYYLSFVKNGTTYYIAIVASGTHINMNYVTTKTSLWWNPIYKCFGDEDWEYFLCLNSTYGCFYCSAVSSWMGSSPIATLYEKTSVEYIKIDGLDTVYVGDTARLSIISNTGAYPSVTWTVTKVNVEPDSETEVNDGYTATGTSLTMVCSEAATYHITAVESSNEAITDEFTLTVSALPGTVYATGYYGIPVDQSSGSLEATLYIDGTTIAGRDYEGTLVSDISQAVSVTISYAESTSTDYGCYLYFRYEGTTYFITIALIGGYQDLSYSTTAALLYWDATNSIWTNAAGTYFLCYNSAYDCLYASAVSTYGPNSENASPVAHFISADGGNTGDTGTTGVQDS